LLGSGGPGPSGPYSEPARQLLDEHAGGLVRVLALYDELADGVVDPSRLVITHGEPHAGNVMVTGDALKLVDWE
jgi:spectinomycin phosphotransferase